MIDSDQYYTPPHFFEQLGLTFALDVAAPPGGVPWIPARRFFCEADDGLSQPWRGRVWMNPPFSGPGPWVDKFLSHGNGIALVVISKANWFRSLWHSDCDFAFPEAHTKFIRNGKPSGIMFPTVFVAAGDKCKAAIRRLGKTR